MYSCINRNAQYCFIHANLHTHTQYACNFVNADLEGFRLVCVTKCVKKRHFILDSAHVFDSEFCMLAGTATARHVTKNQLCEFAICRKEVVDLRADLTQCAVDSMHIHVGYVAMC